MWTSGSAAMERPVCVLIHRLVVANIFALVATQGYIQFATGSREPYNGTWMFASFASIFVHVAAAFVHAWLAGDPILPRGDGGSWGEGGPSSNDSGVGGDGTGDGGSTP